MAPGGSGGGAVTQEDIKQSNAVEKRPAVHCPFKAQQAPQTVGQQTAVCPEKQGGE